MVSCIALGRSVSAGKLLSPRYWTFDTVPYITGLPILSLNAGVRYDRYGSLSAVRDVDETVHNKLAMSKLNTLL